MTQDRRFKHRVRRRMHQTGENYAAALAAERKTRPPPRHAPVRPHSNESKESAVMETKPAAATRLRGIWMGVFDIERTRAFYELLGAYFDDASPDGIVYATLGGTRLIFESGSGTPPGTGAFLLFDVTDADALHAELQEVGCPIEGPPKNEPWGRQFNVLDPDGHSIAFIGPIR